MATANLGLLPLALRRNQDQEMAQILAMGASGGGPRIIGAGGSVPSGNAGSQIGAGLGAIGGLLEKFGSMRKAQEAEAQKKAADQTMQQAAQAFSGGVKEWRNPDNPDQTLVQGQKPGLGAALDVLGGNTTTAPMALQARMDMATSGKTPPLSMEARMKLAQSLDPDGADKNLWAMAKAAPDDILLGYVTSRYVELPKAGTDKVDLYDPKTGTKQTVRVGSETERYFRDKGWSDTTTESESPYGNSFDGSLLNIADQLAGKIDRGEPLTGAETRQYQAALSRLGAVRTYQLPDGRVVSMPGMNVSGYPAFGGSGGMTMTAGAGADESVPGMPGATVVGTKPKSFNESQSTSAGYANRMAQAAERMGGLVGKGFNPANLYDRTAENLPGGNFIVSKEFQQYRQAQEDWVRAKLRKESGAVIGDEEMEREIQTYFPQPGDSPEVQAQKEQSRKTALDSMIGSSGGAYDTMFGGTPGAGAKPAGAPQINSVSDLNRMIGSGELKPGDQFLSPSGALLVILPDGSWGRLPDAGSGNRP